jgi:hypothetical protein
VDVGLEHLVAELLGGNVQPEVGHSPQVEPSTIRAADESEKYLLAPRAPRHDAWAVEVDNHLSHGTDFPTADTFHDGNADVDREEFAERSGDRVAVERDAHR